MLDIPVACYSGMEEDIKEHFSFVVVVVVVCCPSGAVLSLF